MSKNEIFEITNDSGFLAIADASNYISFINKDWDFINAATHFIEAMNEQQMIIWQTSNDGGGHWRVSITDTPSKNPFREFTKTIRVTEGKLFLTNLEDLSMAAQFEDIKIPSEHNARLFFEVPDGLHAINVRQLFNPDEYGSNEKNTDFEIVIAPVEEQSMPESNIFWSTY